MVPITYQSVIPSYTPFPSQATQKKSQTQSKACEKCYRTSSRCNKANRSLKVAKDTIKALRKEVVEVTLRDLEKDEVIRKLKEKNAALQETVYNLQEPNSSTSSDMQSEIATSSEYDDTISEVLENGLIDSASSVLGEDLDLDMGIFENLPAYILKVSSRSQDYFPEITSGDCQKTSSIQYFTPTPDIIETPSDLNDLLENLLNIQEIFTKNNFASEAAVLANQIISKSKTERYQKGARFEQDKFNTQYNNYMSAVEKSIEWIQNNFGRTVDEAPKLPEFPTFSHHFMRAYEIVMKNMEETDECPVCLESLGDVEKTFQCEKCNCQYHDECAANWMESKDECPTCI